ncbi:UNVERIFIED_CONTAM: hypothetical protein RMT77_007612 [Armadillidium vulgare]
MNGHPNISGEDQIHKVKDYNRFLNDVARRREASFVRRLCGLFERSTPSTLNIGGGLPNPSKFPLKDAVFNFKNGDSIYIDEKKMAIAQQYGVTKGYLPLLKQVEELVLRYHNPPNYANSRVIVNIGAQDGFSRTLEMVLSPGDYVIVEEPTFCGALCVMRPLNVNFLGIKIDDQGMIPEHLEEVLSKWNPEEVRDAMSGVPKVIYVNPTASNPSGMTLTKERKKQIYEIARLYNLLIVEDDPYYFLHFGEDNEFPESFLSIDTDGRVMRMDSFAKIISSGFRIGYLTGPEPLVDKYIQHSEMTMMHPSCLSQVVISEILTKWSTEGFENHVKDVRKLYSDRKEALNKAVKKHLSGLCEWNIPAGGMFLWLKVLVLEDTEEMIVKRAFKKELILMTGNPFMIDDKKPCPYLRLSYSFLPPEKFDEACRRTAELIREEVELCAKNKKN